MTMRLAGLQFISLGETRGWTTPPLSFGRILTLVLGPNGTGKTPLLKGLVFALGHPTMLPPDIRKNCRSVILSLADADGTLKIERTLDDAFQTDVVDIDGSRRSFIDEKRFSAWMIERLGIPERQFAARSEPGIVAPYMSALVPMFWIDQDLGWRNLYSPLATHHFIKDQADEIVRWMLRVASKHRAVDKGAFARAKESYESIQEQISIKRDTLAALRRELGQHGSSHGREELLVRRSLLLADLQARSSVLEILAQSESSIDTRLREAIEKRGAATFAVNAAERRLAELRRLGQELEAEVDILETNEMAAGAFRTLCGNEACQFFRRPEESYGRRLLYLKDQLKDFHSSFSTLEQDLDRLRMSLEEHEGTVQAALGEKQRRIAETPEGSLVAAVDAITKGLSEVNLLLLQLERVSKEEDRLGELINRGLRAEEVVTDLRPTRGGTADQTRLSDARAEMTRAFREWLATLRTQNVPASITFDEDLRLHLGDERFSEGSSYSGSTRTRIVLAYHAALVETSLRINGHHPGFLILDAPKQHELHPPDLRAFVTRFREMSAAQNVPTQLIIGATEQDFVDERLADAIWRPTFEMQDGLRFFGPTESKGATGNR